LSYIICIIIIAASVIFDQISKLLVVGFLNREESFVVIPRLFRFTYVENRGAAFGSFDESRWVFMIASTVLIIGLGIYLFKFRPQSKLACVSMSMIIGGGIGNMIDRIRLGYVIDFIDFYAFPNLWKWVFNVADAFVCIGCGLMFLWCLRSIIEESRAEKLKKLENKNPESEE
jgi:signal peptidase II